MKSDSLIYRLLLLLLLPAIAAILYVRGQQYDPGLIDFKQTAGTAEKAGLPVAGRPQTVALPSSDETLAGYSRIGRPQLFTRDNLYEHVNGHAEYFISAGFMGLTVTEYRLAAKDTDQPDLQVEVYDMGNGMQAFGVLSDEAGEKAKPVKVGTMAYARAGGISFFKGRYYVKIAAMNPKTPLLAFAEALSATLPAGNDSLSILSKLPDLGKPGRTRFIKEAYRGLDFVRNVIERDYATEAGTITLALLSSDAAKTEALEKTFLDYFRKSGMQYEKAERDGITFYRVIDRYEGNWLLMPEGGMLFGIFGTQDEAVTGKIHQSRAAR